MPCGEFEEMILDGLEGFLEADRRRELEYHLARCSECREFQAMQQELDGVLSGVLRPPELRSRFRRRLEQRVDVERARPRLPWFPELMDAVQVLAAGAVFNIIDARYAHVLRGIISSFLPLQ